MESESDEEYLPHEISQTIQSAIYPSKIDKAIYNWLYGAQRKVQCAKKFK